MGQYKDDVIDAGDGDNVVRSGGGNDIVTTGFGNDVIDAGAGDDLVRAGAGNDVVDGGSGDDSLVGGDGDDTITGRGGRDIIIGGRGADILIGNQDEDLLIAGRTAFDESPAALGQIMLEWASPRSYVERVKNLSGDSLSATFDCRQNANYFLVGEDQPNQTVFDDGDMDRLTGSQATDWYFASLGAGGNDLITDLARLKQTVDSEF